MKQRQSVREPLDDLLQRTSQAEATLEDCPHLIVYEKDVLVTTCDGSQRFCLICGINEVQDCYRRRRVFSELKNPKILVGSYSFGSQRIKNTDDFLSKVRKDLQASIKDKRAFITDLHISGKRFFFHSVWLGRKGDRIVYEINGKEKGELTNAIINQLIADIRKATE